MSGPLRLVLQPSRAFAVALLVAHGAAGACLALVLPGAPGLFVTAALVALGGIAAWQRALLRGAAAVRAIELEGENRAVLELGDGSRRPVKVGTRRYVSRWLVTLPLRDGAGRTLAVTAGMLGAEAFRALRLWALWGRAPGVALVQLPA